MSSPVISEADFIPDAPFGSDTGTIGDEFTGTNININSNGLFDLHSSQNVPQDVSEDNLKQFYKLAFRLVLDTWSLESATEFGLSHSLLAESDGDYDPFGRLNSIATKEQREAWLEYAQDRYHDKIESGEYAELPTVLFDCLIRTNERCQEIMAKKSLVLHDRLQLRLLQRTEVVLRMALSMLRKRKMHKILNDPATYYYKPIVDDLNNPGGPPVKSALDVGEDEVARIFATNLPNECVRFTGPGSFSLSASRHRIYSVIYPVPLRWFLDELSISYGKFTVEFQKYFDEYGLGDLGQLQDFQLAEYSYELDYFNAITKDFQNLTKNLKRLAKSGAVKEDQVLPIFNTSEYIEGHWLVSGTYFVGNEILMHRLLPQIQGIISAVPC